MRGAVGFYAGDVSALTQYSHYSQAQDGLLLLSDDTNRLLCTYSQTIRTPDHRITITIFISCFTGICLSVCLSVCLFAALRENH